MGGSEDGGRVVLMQPFPKKEGWRQGCNLGGCWSSMFKVFPGEKIMPGSLVNSWPPKMTHPPLSLGLAVPVSGMIPSHSPVGCRSPMSA